MPKIQDMTATIDARGFLRFVSATATTLDITKFPFVDLYIDRTGKRVAMQLSRKEQPGSFRLLDHEGRYLVFIKGALTEAKMSAKPGRLELVRDGKNLVISGKSAKTGTWEYFPCRNSPTIPMASLDSRGTLILDRNCTKALGIPAVDTASAEYDSKKKEITLSLQKKKGDLNVRAVGSHANISLMGTLSSFGIPLPTGRIRTACAIQGKAVKFSVADLLRSTR